ncbi:hypothetical protein [Brachybacterium sp. FME24]|uniref:hypothetical protein n=1 Tax=Brachybacterium sp. FME24 TaxID=2742605 RepID=UPI001868697B|nr:hypothetical protein [Brachybacterium sp. FME24]
MADEVTPFPFATVEELKARWPDFPAGAEDHAEVLLEDASQFILDVCPSAVTVSANTRRRIVCAVVRRSIEAQSSPGAGMSTFQATTGPFTNSYTPTNPHGDFYLTKSERKALGEGRQKAYGGTIAGPIAAAQMHTPWCAFSMGALYCDCGAVLTGGEPLWP